MKLAVFNTKPYDRQFLELANAEAQHEITFLEPRLTLNTVPLADGHDAICAFVNDKLDSNVIEALSDLGVSTIALRCAGFNNVDLEAAAAKDISVVRVPAYSPYAVAEHTLALILGLNRQTYRSHNRVREGNFSLEGLLGFDMNGKTVGIIGTGKIGALFARILSGFNCQLLAYDVATNPDCLAQGVQYVGLDDLFAKSDIISLHCPLTPQTSHIINRQSIEKMKRGVMLVNTSRGGLVDTYAVIQGLKSGKIGYLGLDVYEEEGDLFFEDKSDLIIQDDIFMRLLTFPNVLITAHQAFFTDTALKNIAETTISNLNQIERGELCPNQIKL